MISKRKRQDYWIFSNTFKNKRRKFFYNHIYICEDKIIEKATEMYEMIENAFLDEVDVLILKDDIKFKKREKEAF